MQAPALIVSPFGSCTVTILLTGWLALIGGILPLAGQVSIPAEVISPEDPRISPVLRARLERAAPEERLPVRFLVRTTSDDALPDLLKGCATIPAREAFPAYYIETSLVPDVIPEVLKDVRVVAAEWIRRPREELRQEGLDMTLNRISRLRHEQPGLAGSGRVLSIKEQAFDPQDVDFRNRILMTERTPALIRTHASNMATIAGGGGTSDPTARGVAWASRLTSSDFALLLPDPDAYFTTYAIIVQNHSYGTGIENYYGMETRAYDQQAVHLPGLLHVFSTGNDGDMAPPAGPYAGLTGWANLTGQFKQSKNILTVGGTDSLGRREPLSSVGPAYDGRVKPDVVAFGQSGTSGAAALVSGIGLLIHEAWQEARGVAPGAEAMRGILIHTARDEGRPGPDYEYGFGGVDAVAATTFAQAGNLLVGQLNTSPFRHTIDLPDGTRRLKATLIWTDPPADLMAPKALVHDLDLTVIRVADGRVFEPAVLNAYPHPDSLRQPARPGRDSLNPVEQIVIDNPVTGEYTLQISGLQPSAAGQAFTLLWSVDTTAHFTWEYPTGSDVVYPGRSAILRWTTNLQMTGAASYRLIGSADWIPLESQADPDVGYFIWQPPLMSGPAQVRWETPDSLYVSDTFLIAASPALSVDLLCPDEIRLSWTTDTLADRYRLYRIGDTYLEPYAEVSGTSFVDIMPDTAYQHYAVNAVYAGREGAISPGVQADRQGVGCYLDRFFLTFILEERAHFTLVLSGPEDIASVTLQRLEGVDWLDESTYVPAGQSEWTLISRPLHPGVSHYRAIIRLVSGERIISPSEQVLYVPAGNMVVYPNPVRAGSDIRVLTDQNLSGAVSVTDIAGRLMARGQPEEYPGLISTAGWPAGLYIITVRYPGGRMETRKISVQP